MSKLFPTKEELGRKYETWATLLTFVTFSVWLICFWINLIEVCMPALLVYIFICPVLYLVAMRFAYLTNQYKRSLSGKVLIVFSVSFFLLSLAAWFVPV